MHLVSYAIRILPLTLIRKPIKNRFIQSFLYYVPYVTLAVMTFPQLAFDEMHTSSPVLFLVDMQMYADVESTFMKYVDKNRSLLSKTAFIPMLTWKVSTAMQRELIQWADSYLVLPYDAQYARRRRQEG